MTHLARESSLWNQLVFGSAEEQTESPEQQVVLDVDKIQWPEEKSEKVEYSPSKDLEKGVTHQDIQRSRRRFFIGLTAVNSLWFYAGWEYAKANSHA